MENNEPLALEMLKELKAESKRRFIIIIVLIAVILCETAGFLFYQYYSLPVEEEVTVENDDGNANYIGEDMNGDLYNGENNSKKAQGN